jgi:hypothetical protein
MKEKEEDLSTLSRRVILMEDEVSFIVLHWTREYVLTIGSLDQREAKG